MNLAGRSQEHHQIACFHVASEEYAVNIMQIKEIINPIRITPVPGAPSFIEGIVELRGAILPVVDLRKRFGVEAAPPTRATKYIIVSIDGNIVGLIVDRVVDVRRIGAEEVMEAPAIAVGAGQKFLSGVYKRDERIIMLLDVSEVLSVAEKQALDQLRGAEA